MQTKRIVVWRDNPQNPPQLWVERIEGAPQWVVSVENDTGSHCVFATHNQGDAVEFAGRVGRLLNIPIVINPN